MWIIRFLNGPLAGQIVPLTKHSTVLGRSPSADIKVASGNVSKEHTRIEVFDDKVIITDAGSRNGTFVNGVQVRSSKAKSGDKVAMHDVFFEVQNVPDNWAQRFAQPMQVYGQPRQNPQQHMGHQSQYQGNAAYQQQGMHQSMEMSEDQPAGDLKGLPKVGAIVANYMEEVVLPGIYRLPEIFEFKWVLAGFMAGFILLVTSLSMIPLAQILRSSLEEESQQHALTIATTLAKVNRPFLMQGAETSVSVDIATSRPGVKKAFIINNMEGNIVAPSRDAGSYPDLPYVHEGRKLGKESVSQIDGNTIVALYPVEQYNSETGSHAITHWAVVLYDMSSLAVDNGRVLSLFITTLFISLLLGVVLFYFLYKVVEHPIQDINKQLDIALKEGLDTLNVAYQFPALQLLASNVSSALTRALSGGDGGGNAKIMEYDRNREITNMVELMGFGTMGVRAADLSIAAVNQAFVERINLPAAQLTTMSINDLTDPAFRLSVLDLLTKVDASPDQIATNDLEFGGNPYQVAVQAVYGTAKISYYLVILLPKGEE